MPRPGDAASDCPSDDMIGALVERALGAAEIEAVTAHLDGCAGCRELVLAAVRAGVGLAGTTPVPPDVVAGGTPTELGPREAVATPVIEDRTVTTAGATGPLGGGAGAGAGAVAGGGPAIGDRVGRYELRRLIGSGGMGRVYEALDPELDRAIALKVMRPELARLSGVLAERLVRESRLMAKVAHPSVIAVHDVGRTADGAVFLAMELIRGETLGAYVRRVRPGWRATVDLLERAGRGLAAAHARGVIHRDFKPDNVLVELDGDRPVRVAVTDFGVARALADELDAAPSGLRPTGDPALTTTGMAVGTPAYMSPEQLDGQIVDHRADVFAFAVTAWELLVGARPFDGRTAAELRVAVDEAPVAPRGAGVPARVIRALVRGLAPEPGARWPDMDAFLAAFAVRPPWRTMRWAIAALAGGALVGLGLAGSRVLAAAPQDACAIGADAVDALVSPPRRLGVTAAIASSPEHGKVAEKLDRAVAAWRATHAAACRPGTEPLRPAKTTACLDARRLELEAVVDDLIADGSRHAGDLINLVGDPAACADPAPGLLAARVPAERDVRRRVTAARHKLFDAEDARDAGDHRGASTAASAVAQEAEALWPPLRAEALYVGATAESFGGDFKRGTAMLREAAALAEKVHHDRIAANVWLQLALVTAFDAGDPARGLEYVDYAAAAVDRIGRPPATVAMLEYTRGAALIEADRTDEAIAPMKRAVELAITDAPEQLAESIQGLGILYEQQGHFTDAIDAYRRALAKLAERAVVTPVTVVIIRGRLAIALVTVGKVAEAEDVMREAVRIADASISSESLDRWVARLNLARVLGDAGKLDEALPLAREGTAQIGRLIGERSERYGEALSLVATLLTERGRFDEAVRQFERACDVVAFGGGEGSSRQAECWIGQINALAGLERFHDGLALAERAVPLLVKAYGERHPQVASAYGQRGQMRFALGRRGAIEDFEHALAVFGERVLDPGHRAAAQWGLGRALWTQQPARARALVEEAVAQFRLANESWAATRREAEAWLADNPVRPARRAGRRR